MNAARTFLGAALAALFAAGAWAADYPERAVKIVVPFAAGSGTDVVARTTAEALSKRLGQPVTVENMPGADGATGAAAVAKAAPDGYTLLATTNAFTIAPYLRKTAPYDAMKDFVPVARLAVIPLVLVTSAKSDFKTFDDLLAYMRANPGKARYASLGRGTLGRLEAEFMLRQSKLTAQGQPYRTGAEALAGTSEGTADFFIANSPLAAKQLKSGTLRALAVTSGARLPQLPNVPTLAEAMKRPGHETVVWFGLLAPAGTPSPAIQRLENELERELELAEVSKRIVRVGGRAAFMRSAPFGGMLRSEYGKWGVVARDNQ